MLRIDNMYLAAFGAAVIDNAEDIAVISRLTGNDKKGLAASVVAADLVVLAGAGIEIVFKQPTKTPFAANFQGIAVALDAEVDAGVILDFDRSTRRRLL